MQCFQKDPNLRVSAKKLLRHPWILSAKKTQSVVPTKPYDEAVKSVQQWNEALKSPGSGTVSRRSRPAVPSAIPTKKSTSSIRKNSKLSNIVTNGEKVIRNPEAFRSPDVNRTDNWDNDFAPSLFSGGLNLPQLKPQDNFAGQLSSDKLKHYATFDSPHDRGNSGRSATDEPPVAYRTQIVQSDPHQTVRPFQGNAKKGPAGARRESSTKLSLNVRHQSSYATKARLTSQKQRQVLHQSPAAFREDSAEDNSDLVATDDIAFERKVQLFKVSILTFSGIHSN